MAPRRSARPAPSSPSGSRTWSRSQVTDFGASGPHAAWQATDSVLYAMSTALSRSGSDHGQAGAAAVRHRVGHRRGAGSVGGARRLLPPTALRHRRLHRLLPVRGRPAVPGSAVRLRGPGRGRPEAVRRAVARPPPQPTDLSDVRRAATDSSGSVCCRRDSGAACGRGSASRSSSPIRSSRPSRPATPRRRSSTPPSRELFGPQTMEALVAEGQRRGVPIAAVLSPADAFASEHFRSVGALTETDVAPGTQLTVPTGPFVVDGGHAGIVRPLRQSVPTSPVDRASGPARRPAAGHVDGRPFDGLRILDLGVIVAGGELGRLFADLGAEVIKVESAAYPDGLRQTPARSADEQILGVDPSQRIQPRPRPAPSRGCRDLRPPGRDVGRGVRQLQAGNSCRPGLLLRRAAQR